MSTLIHKLSQISHPSLISTPDGAFTFKEQNRFIHSSRAPIKEAQRLIQKMPSHCKEKTLIIAWGTGLGYHIESLVNQGNKVLAIELRPQVADLFSQIFSIDKLVGFITTDHPSHIFDLMIQLEEYGFQQFIEIGMLGVSVPITLNQQIQQGKTALLSFHHIYKALMESWYHNILTNISSLEHSHITYTHDPIFDQQYLVICSAGSSLKESLPFLKEYESKLTILAVDTALLSIIQAGIIPDYVHSVDAKIHNISDFRGISHDVLSQITLIADISLDPQIIALPWEKVLLTSTVHPTNNTLKRTALQQYLWDHSIRFPELQTGGSVATSALHAGIFYKAKKILLVGQDLSYSQYRGHAVGSPYDMEYRLKTSRLNSIDTIHIRRIPFDGKELPSIRGQVTITDPLLLQYKEWFETSAKNNQINHIITNASEDGVILQHWNHQPLSSSSYLKDLPNKYYPSYNSLSYPLTTIKNILKKIQDTPIDFTNNQALSKEFFYKEHSSDTIDSITLEKKTYKINKRLQRLLCKNQD